MAAATSHHQASFHGLIYNMLVHPEQPWILVEVRNEAQKLVTFSVLDVDNGKLILNHYQFEEPWWVSLSHVSDEMMFLKIYTDQQNPDKKSVIAFNFVSRQVVWWKNDFSITTIASNLVIGAGAKFGEKLVALRVSDGEMASELPEVITEQNFSITRPLQYFEGAVHFETFQQFIGDKFGQIPVRLIEYLETTPYVVVSYYTQQDLNLANILCVLREDGKIVLQEIIGEQLKGIGLDTFFLFKGYLIFVKNKGTLVSYKLV